MRAGSVWFCVVMSIGFIVSVRRSFKAGWGGYQAKAVSSFKSSSTSSDTRVLAATMTSHTASVIFLHGLGDTGAGWQPVVPMLKQPYIRFILPTAPVRPVSLNGGMSMPAWTDLYGLDASAREDEAGFANSVKTVEDLVEAEISAGVPSERIVIGGFSQGAAVVLTSHLRMKKKIAGSIVMSGWLPLRNSYPASLSEANLQSPILMCHGERDGVVPYEFGVESRKKLEQLGYTVSFKGFSTLDHGADPEELQAVRQFIQQMLPEA